MGYACAYRCERFLPRKEVRLVFYSDRQDHLKSLRDSLLFTNLFGGTNGNEGLGFLSICFDWQYVGAGPLYLPLQTLTNNFVGYVCCIALFMGLYYANIWRAKDFPFLSQLLYDGNLSNGTVVSRPELSFAHSPLDCLSYNVKSRTRCSNALSNGQYSLYNQTAILNNKSELDEAKLASAGLPYLSSSYVSTLISGNMAVVAGIVHLLLWNYNDLKSGWSFLHPHRFRKYFRLSSWSLKSWTESNGTDEQEPLDDRLADPHYKLMRSYKDAPNWWYGLVLLASFIVSMVVIYTCHSTLPWWGLIIALLISYIFIIFFGALYAVSSSSAVLLPAKAMTVRNLNAEY